MVKRKSKLLIALILLLIIIITPNISRADDDEVYDDEEFKFYTIEELIFNKVEALDVNIFDNSGLRENSLIMNIRNSIATWYVSFRNIAIICLGLTIIYIGLRLAIATVANDKANYKKMLINWITATLIVYLIHVVMIFALNINDSLLEILYPETLSTGSIYETIRTRLNDLRFMTWVPALIIYIILFMYSLMFLWVYIKRYFTIMILIIVAPFVGVKYAIDSAGKGQRSKILSTWIYEFTMNVFLQSVHALIYTVLMGIAVDLAITSIFGFIIALVFMNFILKADKIFMKIFSFNRSKLVGDISKPVTNPKEDFATAYFIAGTAWDFAGGVKDVALYGGRQVGRLGKKAYRYGTNLIGEKIYKDEISNNINNANGTEGTENINNTYRNKNKSGKKLRDNIEEKRNNILNKVDNKLNQVYKKVTPNHKDSSYLRLAVMSRRKDTTGIAARKQLRKAKNNVKARFTAPFKFIKSAGGAVLKVSVGVPVSVVNLGAGLGLITSGTQDLVKMGTKRDKKGNKYKGTEGLAQAATLGAYGTYKELKKDKDKMGKTVEHFNKAVIKENEIEEEFKKRFEKTSREAIDKYKRELKFYITYGNKENVGMILRQRMAYRGISKINGKNIDFIIEQMADDMFAELKIGNQYSKEQADKIKRAMIDKTKDAFRQAEENAQEEEFGSLEMAQSFSEAIRDEGISDETDIDNIQDMTSRFVDEMSFEEANLEDSVDQIANGVMEELHMEEKTSKEEKEKIIEDAKEILIDKRKSDPNVEKISKDTVAKSIHSSIRRNISKDNLRNKFGFGNITSKVEELHNINVKAQDDVKTNVVRVNKFIDSLNI